MSKAYYLCCDTCKVISNVGQGPYCQDADYLAANPLDRRIYGRQALCDFLFAHENHALRFISEQPAWDLKDLEDYREAGKEADQDRTNVSLFPDKMECSIALTEADAANVEKLMAEMTGKPCLNADGKKVGEVAHVFPPGPDGKLKISVLITDPEILANIQRAPASSLGFKILK